MYIKNSFIESLLDRVDIVEVIGRLTKIEKSGANYKGLSPFSKERTPSFIVSPVKKIWKDFSNGNGGDVVSFVIQYKRCTYPEAIKIIAEMYNEPVQYEEVTYTKDQKQKLEDKEIQKKVINQVFELYKIKDSLFVETNHPAIIELKKRDYTMDDVIEWGIGYAPDNILYNVFKQKGLVNVLEDLNLVLKHQSYYNDKYKNRLVYPIHDYNGVVVGFAGRILDNESKSAKWINPNVDDHNLIYNKSKILFGLHRAKYEIRKTNEVYLVEGYNDVIAWHKYGLPNTVASCGTAITEEQLLQLKKLCDTLIFTFDPDKAGKAAVLKTIPIAIGLGFRTKVLFLEVDPDDFSRKYKEDILKNQGLQNFHLIQDYKRDGFAFLLEHKLVGDEVSISSAAKEVCEILAKIKEDSHIEIYTKWLSKESKISLTTIKKWIKDFQKKIEATASVQEYNEEYELPKKVKVSIKEIEPIIKNYGFFMANSQIWMAQDKDLDGKTRFSSISNFEIEVLQHMQDEKVALKLFRIKNTYGLEKIFDEPSENLNTPQNFDNMITKYGNFRFDGSRKDLLLVRKYLFDTMGVGRKIDVLGWQVDAKVWVWNNKVTDEEGNAIEITEHGIFIIDKIHYYVPSANVIYTNNNFKYVSQKKFRVIENKTVFSVFALKLKKVHRDHAISALLFAISSMFQDIVVEKIASFPLLFFYGPGSSGKDELCAIIQSFFGVPQSAINLEGNVSTIKAQVREFAQFKNSICQLSEYKRGNSQLNGVLKALWDRRGYKRGNIDSHVGTDEVPIESSCILTGNDFPDEEPLIIRTIWNEMTKNQFTQEEMKEFDELRDLRENGLSCYTDKIFLPKRLDFKQGFEKKQRQWKKTLQELFPEAKGRIVQNLSVLATTYEIFKDHVSFPFTQEEMIDHFRTGVNQQIRKINASSVINKFWDCFLACLRGPKEQRIQVGYIVNIENDTLYIQFTDCHSRIATEWYNRFKEIAPNKAFLKEQIKESGAFIQDLNVYSYSTGRGANRSSATAINLNAIPEDIKESIVAAVMKQLNEGSIFEKESPATPEGQEILEELDFDGTSDVHF